MKSIVQLPIVVLAVVFPLQAAAVGQGQTKSTAADAPQEKPNIVLLLADDQCTYSLGCYGNGDVQTPNIDRLASDGLTFDAHYVPTAICMASRASIMTGLYEYRHGCNFEHGPLMQQHWLKSYPMLLRQAGYRTAMAGKIGFEVAQETGKRAKSELPKGDFDAWGAGPGQTHYETKRNASIAEYAEEYPHSTLAYAAFAEDFIAESARKKQPFCLSISFKAPHRPVQPDPRFDAVYAGATFTKPANYGRRYGEHFAQQSRGGRQFVRFEEWGYSDDYDAVMAKYHQQIHGIDVAVGRIRQSLEKHGCSDNTVVIYTSDNGFMCGSHGYGSKVLPYEEASRVPLIIHDPRLDSTRGLRTQALTGSIDLAPTILRLAGLNPDTAIDGVSLVPLLRDASDSVRDNITLLNVWGPRSVHSLSVMLGQWKFIYWPYSGDGMKPAEELYNIAEDPLELTNLAGDSMASDRLVQLREHYDAAVEHWRDHAAPYHNYRQFADVFTRKENRKE